MINFSMQSKRAKLRRLFTIFLIYLPFAAGGAVAVFPFVLDIFTPMIGQYMLLGYSLAFWLTSFITISVFVCNYLFCEIILSNKNFTEKNNEKYPKAFHIYEAIHKSLINNSRNSTLVNEDKEFLGEYYSLFTSRKEWEEFLSENNRREINKLIYQLLLEKVRLIKIELDKDPDYRNQESNRYKVILHDNIQPLIAELMKKNQEIKKPNPFIFLFHDFQTAFRSIGSPSFNESTASSAFLFDELVAKAINDNSASNAENIKKDEEQANRDNFFDDKKSDSDDETSDSDDRKSDSDDEKSELLSKAKNYVENIYHVSRWIHSKDEASDHFIRQCDQEIQDYKRLKRFSELGQIRKLIGIFQLTLLMCLPLSWLAKLGWYDSKNDLYYKRINGEFVGFRLKEVAQYDSRGPLGSGSGDPLKRHPLGMARRIYAGSLLAFGFLAGSAVGIFYYALTYAGLGGVKAFHDYLGNFYAPISALLATAVALCLTVIIAQPAIDLGLKMWDRVIRIINAIEKKDWGVLYYIFFDKLNKPQALLLVVSVGLASYATFGISFFTIPSTLDALWSIPHSAAIVLGLLGFLANTLFVWQGAKASVKIIKIPFQWLFLQFMNFIEACFKESKGWKGACTFVFLLPVTLFVMLPAYMLLSILTWVITGSSNSQELLNSWLILVNGYRIQETQGMSFTQKLWFYLKAALFSLGYIIMGLISFICTGEWDPIGFFKMNQELYIKDRKRAAKAEKNNRFMLILYVSFRVLIYLISAILLVPARVCGLNLISSVGFRFRRAVNAMGNGLIGGCVIWLTSGIFMGFLSFAGLSILSLSAMAANPKLDPGNYNANHGLVVYRKKNGLFYRQAGQKASDYDQKVNHIRIEDLSNGFRYCQASEGPMLEEKERPTLVKKLQECIFNKFLGYYFFDYDIDFDVYVSSSMSRYTSPQLEGSISIRQSELRDATYQSNGDFKAALLSKFQKDNLIAAGRYSLDAVLDCSKDQSGKKQMNETKISNVPFKAYGKNRHLCIYYRTKAASPRYA